ncbi:MAG: methicillin resistance protein [Candidatus Berkelbacteria bacterium Licking1014_7]|uniref:Methicillin resistance protein n=1 Tax=Candidatus Berkelbacteria bacterium Licking1014_7 TaxID=2017147 RepID=A0A554LK83_9BACT|nr:MAG: methicillin resistance protein [Candidatus Berkelbacteria bacterium Licking1014_7]
MNPFQNAMPASFLQSEKWEDFQKATGKPVFRIQNALIIKNDLPFGKSWLYVPRISAITDLDKFFCEVMSLSKKERAIFCKIEPENFPLEQKIISNVKQKLNVLTPAKAVQPTTTLRLDLSKSEDEILEQMKPKTRYNIRLALRNRVEVIQGKTIKQFWSLAQKTALRQEIKFHSKLYYEKMAQILADDLKIYYAAQGEKILAGALILQWGSVGYYLHGASDWSSRQLMASFALHWEIIKLVKKAGCRWYDFWGIAPAPGRGNAKSQNKKQEYEFDASHPWAGIARFKLGFAPQGKVIVYPLAIDLIFEPFWYNVYSVRGKFKFFKIEN